MISILLPSRKRNLQFKLMLDSLIATATGPFEIVARFDDDDQNSADFARDLGAVVIVGPRVREITKYWNECAAVAKGEILCQANDDLVSKTKGWNAMVQNAFDARRDKILLVHGDDAYCHHSKFGPHPFLHRRWIEEQGFFIPPYFSSDFGDTWNCEIADMLGRRLYLPFIFAHEHYVFGRCEQDENTKDRLERHRQDNPEAKYRDTLPERLAVFERLRKLMTA